MRTVLYTVLIGNYDWLNNVRHLSSYFDTICYTNNKKLIKKGKVKGWNIVDINVIGKFTKNKHTESKSDILVLTRWLKFFPHIHFANYNNSIYIDANLFPYKSIINYAKNCIKKNVELSLFIHPHRKSVKQEICHAFWNKKVNSAEFREMKKFYFSKFKDGNLIDDILFENNLRFTKHKSKKSNSILEYTFKLYKKMPYRDQVILPLAFKKFKDENGEINFECDSFNYFRRKPHKTSTLLDIRRYLISQNIFYKIISFPINLILKIMEKIYFLINN